MMNPVSLKSYSGCHCLYAPFLIVFNPNTYTVCLDTPKIAQLEVRPSFLSGATIPMRAQMISLSPDTLVMFDERHLMEATCMWIDSPSLGLPVHL